VRLLATHSMVRSCRTRHVLLYDFRPVTYDGKYFNFGLGQGVSSGNDVDYQHDSLRDQSNTSTTTGVRRMPRGGLNQVNQSMQSAEPRRESKMVKTLTFDKLE